MVESGTPHHDRSSQPRTEVEPVQPRKTSIKPWRRFAAVTAGLALTLPLSACSIDPESSSGQGSSITASAEPGHYALEADPLSIMKDFNMPLKPDEFGLEGQYKGQASEKFFTTEKQEVFHSSDGSERYIIPLIKLGLKDEKVELVDTSPSGVDSTVISWMKANIIELEPYLKAAFEQGTLTEVIIGTEALPGYGNSEYSSIDKKLLLDIDFNEAIISAKDTRYTLAHELGHANFANKPISAISEERADAQQEREFNEACASIRTIAIDELEEGFYEVSPMLEQLAEAEPGSEKIIAHIIKAARQGRLKELYPTKAGDINTDTDMPTCEFTSLNRLIGRVKQQLYPKSPTTDLTSESRKIYGELSEFIDTFATTISIYSAFTDKTYTLGEGGHPYSNLDEAAASQFMITVLFPEKFGAQLRALPSEQREAILKQYNMTMEQFMTNEALRELLSPKVDKVNA